MIGIRFLNPFTTMIALVIFMFSIVACEPSISVDPIVKPEFVIVIGIDGLSPKGIQGTGTPNIDALIASGAHTFNATAVIPTVSSPNWTSLISGAPPENHGIFSNTWFPVDVRTKATYIGSRGRFPTMFGELRDKAPSLHTAGFLEWGGFMPLIEDSTANILVDTNSPEDTIDKATAYFKQFRPAMTLIHIDHVDAALHGHGFMTTQYLTAVSRADALVGLMVDFLKSEGILGKTVIIITSDHGGKDKGHGGNSIDEMTIPWIIAGPGVNNGHTIKQPVRIYDTAPTVLHLLGVDAPSYWTGVVVRDAFFNE